MDLSTHELQLCKQLRDRTSHLKVVDELEKEKYNMVRFLRACNMDIVKAEAKFRKYVGWCEENDMYKTRTCDVPQEIKTNFRYRITGLSKRGGLVICVDFGDRSAHLVSSMYEDLMKYAFHELRVVAEYQHYLSKQRNSLSKLVAIFNLKHFSFAQTRKTDCIRALLNFLKAFDVNFPERLSRAYVLSAPWAFSLVWSTCKPLISTKSYGLLQVLGSDNEKWRAEILQLVDEDQFPESLGGTLPEENEMRTELFDKNCGVNTSLMVALRNTLNAVIPFFHPMQIQYSNGIFILSLTSIASAKHITALGNRIFFYHPNTSTETSFSNLFGILTRTKSN